MTPTKEPHPRCEPAPWQPIDWPVRRTVALRSLPPTPSARFSDVMAYRRSERRMTALPLGQVLDVLRFSSALRSGWIYKGIDRHKAPAISGGGLHGIHLVIAPHAMHARLFRYDRAADQLEALNVARPERIINLFGQACACLPEANGTIVGLIADHAKYIAAYEEGESLIWRDSGALLQVIAMSAFAFGFACCPLGLHGVEIVESLNVRADRLLACGLLQIGRYAGAEV